MIVLKPTTITDAILTDSDISEPDSTYDYGATLWAAGAYLTGAFVYKTSTHKIYECVAETSTTDDPTGTGQGINADPPTWVVTASTNKYRMFNGVVSEGTQSAADFMVEFLPGTIIDGIAGVNLIGVESVQIIYYDGDDEIIYDSTIILRDESLIVDWYEFFTIPPENRTTFVALDLPGVYPEARTTVKFFGEDMTIGELIIGGQVSIGIANHGSSFEYLDFSRRVRDEFGAYSIIARETSQSTNYDVTIEYGRIGYVKNQIAAFTGRFTTPVVWIGTNALDDVTLTYGFLERYIQNIDTPTLCKATFEVQGLT